MITGVHHFALAVSDMERSVSFYEMFGLHLVSERTVDGGYVEEITAVPDARVRIAHLCGHGHRLELLHYERPSGAAAARALPDAGSAHVCFTNSDVEVAHRWLADRGVRLRSAPVTTTSGPNRGGRGFYAEDPDGNAVEVIELAHSTAARQPLTHRAQEDGSG